MDDQERRVSGNATRRKVLGSTYVNRAASTATPFSADLRDLTARYAWSEIWTRDGLDERTRRVLVLGTLIALGRWEEFEMHVRSALTVGGVGADTLKEIILQQAIYCGLPAAHHAMRVAQRVLGDKPTR